MEKAKPLARDVVAARLQAAGLDAKTTNAALSYMDAHWVRSIAEKPDDWYAGRDDGDLLSHGFIWWLTPEGHAFWHAAYKRITGRAL